MTIFRTSISKKLTKLLPLDLYCRKVSAWRRISGHSCRLHSLGSDNIIVVTDHKSRHPLQLHICRRTRHGRYKHGIITQIEGLARSYCLDRINLEPNGVLVDCGANIGELGLWARINGLAYIAFEPEPLEARCCDLNNFGGKPRTIRKALWKETKIMELFSKPDTADSSIIPIDDVDSIGSVQAVRMDEVVDVSQFGAGTRILKLVGEGAEPEILLGSECILPHFDFVAADFGPERGRNAEYTFVDGANLLLEHGFKLIQTNLRRSRALFRNEIRLQKT
ncbi:MAG: FkbM family methyltransferase [Rhodobacteraceae bacterium]|nr:FkbM family methyltransferase [Paracoccaceae bacterium]